MKGQNKVIFASVIGNLTEAFDMAICGLLSIYLAKYLIGDASKGIFWIFLTFFAGYLARPLGATIMGALSDIYGRKIILAVSVFGMGVSTALISLIPSNTRIGIASMLCLLVLRVIQSFSAGAEFLNSSVYLVESSENTHKGYHGSWASFGVMAGMLCASLVALLVTWLSTQYPQFEPIIWRLAFVLAFFGSAIGFYIRRRLPESAEYVAYYEHRPKPEYKKLLNRSFHYMKQHKLKAFYVFVLSCLGVASTFQIYIFAPSQAHVYGHFSDHQIIFANIFSLSVLLCCFPFFGRLSDKVNRQKTIAIASLGFMVLIQPFFYFLASENYYAFLGMQAAISIPASAYYATMLVHISDIFPLNLRCTILSVLYSCAASLSAGLIPLFSLLLIKNTHNPVSPAWLLIGLIILALTVMRLSFIKHNQVELVF